MARVSADEALERLKQGNERFRSGRPRGVGSRRPEEFIDGQEPFAVVLGCSDSRVPIEIVFDSDIGELFVVRVAGNVASTASVASIEYAVAQLGTKLIVVMGHQNCGAVTAAIEGADSGRNLNRLMSHIEPSIQGPGEEVDDVARRNARRSARQLLDESDIIRSAVGKDGVKIVTAFYRFSSGGVEFE